MSRQGRAKRAGEHSLLATALSVAGFIVVAWAIGGLIDSSRWTLFDFLTTSASGVLLMGPFFYWSITRNRRRNDHDDLEAAEP